MTQIVYFNGDFVPLDTARVSVQDGGWLHGAALFETMRAEGGRVFRLESHLARLMNSAEKVLRPIRRDELPSRVDILDLLERCGLREGRIRLTASAGSMTVNGDAGPSSLNVCVTAIPLAAPQRQVYERGIVVAICDFRTSPTDPLAGHKTTSHLGRLMGLREAQRARCMEALWFTTASQLAEGSISNVFIVKEGTLKTPPLETPVLPGIARGLVLDLARSAGIAACECALTIDDLLDADEVLITNAIMQVVPVIRVEQRDIGSGNVGLLATTLLEAYRELVKKECGEE